MTRRDLAWRLSGVVLTAGACTACLLLDRSPLMVPLFDLALLGLPLMVHGKHVAQVLRAERHGHALTAAAVHARSCARGGRTAMASAREARRRSPARCGGLAPPLGQPHHLAAARQRRERAGEVGTAEWLGELR